MQFLNTTGGTEVDICIKFLSEILVDLIDRSNCFHSSGKLQDLFKNVFVGRISAVSNNPAIGFGNALCIKPSSLPKFINEFVDLGIINLHLVRKGHRHDNL